MAVYGSEPPVGVIVPHLVVQDVDEAVQFYRAAFDAEELYRSLSPTSGGQHVHLRILRSLVLVSTEEPAERANRMQVSQLAAPETLGGSTCVFQIRVQDVDHAYERAVRSGATPLMPVTDMFWGDRYGWVRDPFGHVWALSAVQEVLTAAEIGARMSHFADERKA